MSHSAKERVTCTGPVLVHLTQYKGTCDLYRNSAGSSHTVQRNVWLVPEQCWFIWHSTKERVTCTGTVLVHLTQYKGTCDLYWNSAGSLYRIQLQLQHLLDKSLHYLLQ